MVNVRQFTIKCWGCGIDIPVIIDCEKCNLGKAKCLGSMIPPCASGSAFCSLGCEFNAHRENHWDD
jgi:hypothetical protein